MNNNNSEFSRLLKYLDENEKKNDNINKKSKIKKEKNNVENLLQKIKEKDDKVEYKNNVCENNNSNGFNVNRFENLMRSKLIDNSKKLSSYDRPYISVSELYNCLRKSYFQRKGYDIDTKSQYLFSYLLLIQTIGNKIHEFIQEVYDFTEIEKTLISEKYKVKGRVDAIKDNYVCEIKTIDDKKFKNNYIQDHYIQSNIYAHLLNDEYNYNIDYVTIIYVPRNLKNIYAYDIKYNKDEAIKYLKYGLYLKKCLDDNIIPDMINQTNEQCNYCPFKNNPCKKEKNNSYEEIKNDKQNKNDDVVFLL